MSRGAFDVGRAPDPAREVRLRLDDDAGRARVRVSIWLPADAEAAGLAMKALGEAGLEFDRGPFDQPAGEGGA